MTDPNLRQAKGALERLSADPRAQHLAFERQIELNSRERYLEIAREKAQAEGLEKGRTEGLEKGRTEGLEKGAANALRETVELLCGATGVELTVARRTTLDVASLDDLRGIVSALVLERAWPER